MIEDISDSMSTATTNPQEAAKNIEGSKVYDMNPNDFNDYKEQLQPSVDALMRPQKASKVVARYVAADPQQASLAAKSVPELSLTEGIIKSIGDSINDHNDRSEMARISGKMLWGKKVTEDEKQILQALNESTITKEEPTFGKSLLDSTIDLGFSIWDNPAPIAAASIVGAVSPVPGGFLTGLSVSSGAAMLNDQFNNQAALQYNDMTNMKTANGKPLDHEYKKNLALGTAGVTAALGIAGGAVLAKTTPVLFGYFSPKAVSKIASDPTRAAIKKVLFNIGKAFAAEGTEESSQEIVQIISEETARIKGGSEPEFLNAITTAEKRIGTAFALGGVMGGGLSTVGNIAGFKEIRKGFKGELSAAEKKAVAGAKYKIKGGEQTNSVKEAFKSDIVSRTEKNGQSSPITPEGKALEAAAFGEMFSESSKKLKTTEMYGIAPQEASGLAVQMHQDAGHPTPYIDREDLTKFADSPEKAKDVQELLKDIPPNTEGTHAPIKIEVEQFAPFVDKYPEAADLVKARPEGPSAGEGRKFIEGLASAENKRKEMLAELGAKDITLEQKLTLESALNPPKLSHDVFNEASYLDERSFEQAMHSIVPDKELESYIEAQQRAKLKVVDNINETAFHEMNQVKDIFVEQAEEVQTQIETNKIKNDHDFKIVDKFTKNFDRPEIYPTARFKLKEEMTANHRKPGFSPFAIDPRTLPKKLLKYVDNEQLKKHKVFVQGGISADDSAKLLGAGSGENLLKILSSTPTRAEAIAENVAKRAKEFRDLADKNVDLNETAISNAYSDRLSNTLKTLRYMVSKEWKDTKAGIKRIALTPPTVPEITAQAKSAISQVKVGDLNPNQWKAGERKSHRVAVTSILKNEYEKAYSAYKGVALNIALTKETQIAIGKVNRVLRFAKKFNDPEVMKALMFAGKEYHKAATELLDLFNLNASKKGLSEVGDFRKFAKKQIERGIGDFTVPERLSTLKESVNDLTVEQTLLIGDRLKSILYTAERINDLNETFGADARNLQETVQKLHEVSINHPDYNSDNTVVSQGSLDLGPKIIYSIQDGLSMFKNMEHILLNADNGIVGGEYNNLMAMLKGVGKYENQGENGKSNDMARLKKEFEKIIDSFGKSEWKKLENTIVIVPEFEKIKALSYGRLTKGNLFVMMLNRGNEGNLQRMSDNFGVKPETIAAVLDRELDAKHAVAAQRIMDTQGSYFPRVKELHEKTMGVTPEAVVAQPFEHRGVVYPGGYYKLTYSSEMSLDKIRKRTDQVINATTGEKTFDLSNHFYADDMTLHGHTEERTGSTEPISITMGSIGNGFETIIHDLNFRKPIADALKIVTDPTVAKDLGATVGISDYNVVVNSIVDAARSNQMENNALFDSAKLFDKIQANARSGLSVGYLVGNITSHLIQPTSMIYAIERMGTSGQKHLLKTLSSIGSQAHKLEEFYQFAGEINPAIKEVLQGLDENTRDVVSRLTPVKNTQLPLGLTKLTTPLDAMREFVNEHGFKSLGKMDQIQKVVISISGYSQFMAGDAPGFSSEKISKMTESERDHQAKVYASSLARLTLTAGSRLDKAPIQKAPWLRNSVMFWNDARNALNNSFRQGREIRQAAQAGEYSKSAGHTVTALMTVATVKLLNDLIRGNENPITGTEQPEDPIEKAASWTTYLASSPFEINAQNTPFIRDGLWALQKYGTNRDVQTTSTKAASDVVSTIGLAYDYMTAWDETEATRKQAKSAAFTASYVVGGIPVNALFKLYDVLDAEAETYENPPTGAELLGTGLIATFLTTFELFKQNHPDAPPEIIQQMEDIKSLVEPEATETSILPPDTMEIIRQAESRGGVKAGKNARSSAEGHFQFIKKTWNDVMEQAPELELTRKGRTGRSAKSIAEQERAFTWLATQNADILQKAKLPVTVENLYSAHLVSPSSTKEILKAKESTPIEDVLTEGQLESNPYLRGLTVGGYKNWISRTVNDATERYDDIQFDKAVKAQEQGQLVSKELP